MTFNIEKWYFAAERFVQKHFLAFSFTLIIHLFFFSILIFIEMSKPDPPHPFEIVIDFENVKENSDYNQNDQLPKKEDQGENIKNVEKNLGEKEKSFDDYYREAQQILQKSRPGEVFKANDYNELRNLAKDYSKEIPDIEKWNQPIIDNNNSASTQSNKTYAGHAIVSYDVGGRKALRLPIPAYKCLGQGKVTISVIVNASGYVVDAKIIETSSSLTETCHPESALQAAKNSRFEPVAGISNQKGIIYYTFIAQ